MTFVVIEFVITIFGAMEFVVINCFAFGEMEFGDLAIWRNVYTPQEPLTHESLTSNETMFRTNLNGS